MTSPTSLADCLRAAEADAARAPAPWAGARRGRGPLLAAGCALLAIGAALVLAQGPADHVTVPPVAPAAQGTWFTPTPSDDDTPETTAAPATDAKPPALAAPAAWVALDGGDLDLAESMPASALTTPVGDDTPQVAPMNVPTGPDAMAATRGEFDGVSAD